MCGIVGFVGARADMQEILQGMMDAIAHRGPDGQGQFIEGPAALGQRRLSIIDLEGGKQPMFNEDQNLAVIFNGEIYNFQELTAELMRAGHTFATRSDTEVLLHGYEQWGKEMLQKLRGMFTFAIWDRRNETLFCARDHFGIKPFYYYQNDAGELLFGSEIKSFLAHPGFKKELNEEQLPLYLSYQYSPGEDTFFKGVKKLMPAHWLEWKAGQLTVQRYWQPKFDPDDSRTLEEWEDEISAAMKESVQAHKIADVEVGSFLSSGVDSSYMAALAHVDKTFTVGFANKQYDETDYAQEFSKHIGVKNYAYRITPEEYWANLGKIQYHMDEPLADAASVALYFVNREASKQVKVCLSGEGADEFFGGYNIYKEPNHQVQNFFQSEYYDFDPVLKLSDYNRLLELRKMPLLSLNDNEYYIVTNSKFAYEVEDNKDIETITVANKNLKLKGYDTKSYWNSITNTGRFVVVLPDKYVQGLEVSENHLIIDTKEETDAELENKIKEDMQHQLVKVDKNGEINDESYRVNVRGAEIEQQKAMVAIVASLFMYIAFILISAVGTILAVQSLSDSTKYKYRYLTLRRLGINDKSLFKTIRKQLLILFCVPAISAILCSFVMMSSLNNVYQQILGDKHLYLIYFGLNLIIFFLIYSIYWIATYIGFKRNINEES